MYTDPKKMAARFASSMTATKRAARKPKSDFATQKPSSKPECLEGYGDGPSHCTLPVGHRGLCNHR